MRKLIAASVVAGLSFSGSAVMANTTSCNSVAACMFGANSSSGSGLGGSSRTGSGLTGLSTSGFGAAGISQSNHGLNGLSYTSFGVVGWTLANAISVGTARAGVWGQDASTNGNNYNSGVAGTSRNGFGVSGRSPNGLGVYGTSSDNVGVFGSSQGYVGVEGFTPYDGFAIYGFSGTGTALELGTASGKILEGGSSVGGYAISVDARGNMVLAGSITSSGSPLVQTATATGTKVAAYTPRSSSPTIEDFGKGVLRNGVAYVPVERTFASTIDAQSYSVFLTPEGDSKGLYTTAMTATGFQVHENQGGHSSLTFSYRVVGRPMDARGARLPLMTKPVLSHSLRLNQKGL